MSERPLAARQVDILLLLDEQGGAWTANQIGIALGYPRSQRRRGPWSGYQAPSQQVVPAIVGLRRRKLLTHAERPDGLSGTADRITEAGRAKARELRAERTG